MGMVKCVALLFCLELTLALKLSDYQTTSFRNPRSSSIFNHFVTYNQTVYIGAIDALYQLDEDFTRQQVVNTAKECEEGQTNCPNYNKILLVHRVDDTLITCESVTGYCALRHLADITNVIHQGSDPVVSPGTLTTEAIIAPGPSDDNALYVAATHDEMRRLEGVYPVRRRVLTGKNVFSGDREGSILLSSDTLAYGGFFIHYISSFTLSDFSYFVQSQIVDIYRLDPDANTYVTKISRLCHQNENLDSYSQILLQCQGTDGHYNLVQAAYLGPAGEQLATSLDLNSMDNVLYGVFAKNEGPDGDIPSNQSALCIFKISDIEAAFIDAIAGCLTEENPYETWYLDGGADGCGKYGLADPMETAERQKCSANNWKYADGIEPSISTAVLEWTDTQPSSIITTTHWSHTVAFVGTAHEQMIKVHIHNSTYAREYERFSVGSPVLSGAEVEQNGKEITILTEQQLLRIEVEKCSEYTTCDECIGSNGVTDGDPYCGWCTLENRCSRYDECPMPDVSTRWLPYNSAQCISISNIEPSDRFPITITDQQIILTVEQLPGLVGGHSYECIFDDNPAMTATTSGNEFTCQTPIASRTPSIPTGQDHVTMQLYVRSTETGVKFVKRDFFFYECNTHKMCIACTDSSWACYWCIYSNKCTHDSSTCIEDDASSIISGLQNLVQTSQHGPTECPQLVAQDVDSQVLVANGLRTEIMVTVENLPDDSKAGNYGCILDIEGRATMSEAERNGDVFTCSAMEYVYAADIQELDVSLSVVWDGDRNLDDVHGFTVTLYKCSVNRPDCSRCLSNTTARPELNCGWCSQDDICTVQGGSCSGGLLLASGGQNCGAPNITKVSPSSGTLNGNTIIAITGTDLGRQFSDILSVKVGNKDCSIDVLEEDYEVGSSVSCRTMPGSNNAMETITVTVRGKDGNEQQSTGNVVFTYRDPSISSIDPQEGLEAGGTIVTFTGQYLDACSEISATIGSECIMNRRRDVLNSTTARCHTTSSSVGSSHRLSVTFDGVTVKQSEDEFTYKPNPEVNDVQPRKTIESGGITLTITGNGFNLAQTPQIVMYVANEEFTGDCEIHNDTMMLCKTPNTKTTSNSISRRRRQAGPLGEASFGFIIGDVSDLLTWSENNNVTMEYFPDPEYFTFNENPRKTKGGVEQINGRNLDAGSLERDVTVYVGTKMAEIITLAENVLTLKLPSQDPGRQCIDGNTTADTCVVVYHGNLSPVYIGDIQYHADDADSLSIALVPGVIGICVIVLLALLLVIVIVVYRVHDKKLKTEIDALIHERLLLLQKRVEEQLQNLNTQANEHQESIILPNNVQINAEDLIRYDDLTIDRLLGHGAFGEVYLANLRSTGGKNQQVAVKSMQGEKDPSTLINFLEEGLIMKDFDHPNVLGLFGLTFDPEGSPLVVLPLMKNGDLKSFLKKTTMEIRTEQRLKFAVDAANGMEYLAVKKFVHRDLAARNCMVASDLLVKIGDFGRSRDMGDEYDYVSNDKKAKLPVKWMAPESLDRRIYNEKTDVWSFGVLMWEIFTDGAKPYRQIPNRNVYYYVTTGNRLPCPENCREDVYDIMQQSWNVDPDKRCRFSELCQKLAMILSVHTQALLGESSDQKLSESADRTSVNVRNSYLELEENPVVNRDSYLHPTEESDRTSVNVRNSYLELEENPVDNRDSYLHPTEEVNEGFVMEMKDL